MRADARRWRAKALQEADDVEVGHQGDGIVRVDGAPDNGSVRSRLGVTLFAVALMSGVAACTGGSHSAPAGHQPSTLAPTTREHPLGTNGQLGAPGCRPASPVSFSGFPQVQGTGRGATRWGLLILAHPLPPRVGDEEKTVWRMTGTEPLTLEAIGPGGITRRPIWGPDQHEGSSWNKPGDEWGAGYVFTAPGCWDLRAARGSATGDVWIRVVSRLPERA
jgi:hypothetical protein